MMMPAKVKPPEAAVPAVRRALDLIEFLADHDRAFGINELARELRVPVNSVFRILKCLAARGYARVDDSGGYQLGPRLFTLGMRLQTRYDLRRQSREPLETLCRQTGETVQIYVLDDRSAVVLDCITPDAPWFIQVVPGGRMELHASAFGKAILAFLPEDELGSLLPQRPERLTPNTIVDRRQLLASLAETRRTGLAYDREEYSLGVYCIGSPVFDARGEVVAGAGVTGLVSRFSPENLHRIEQQVLKCAAAISAAIGHDGRRFASLAGAGTSSNGSTKQ